MGLSEDLEEQSKGWVRTFLSAPGLAASSATARLHRAASRKQPTREHWAKPWGRGGRSGAVAEAASGFSAVGAQGWLQSLLSWNPPAPQPQEPAPTLAVTRSSLPQQESRLPGRCAQPVPNSHSNKMADAGEVAGHLPLRSTLCVCARAGPGSQRPPGRSP